MQTRTNDNQPGGRDLKGHSGVQPWSQGDIFPCIIARVEEYTDEGTLAARWFQLSVPGFSPFVFGSYSLARQVALRHLGRAE